MKFHRIAAAVAVAAIAPAVFLSAPAVAAEKATASPAAQSAGAGQADEAVYPGSPRSGWRGPQLTLTAPAPDARVAAGSWTGLKMAVDNRQGETVEGFNLAFDISGPLAPAKSAELEYRAQDGSWRKAFGNGKVFRIDWGQVKAGDSFTVELRMRFAPNASGLARVLTFATSSSGLSGGSVDCMSQFFDVQPPK
ncbi:hypothetical protein [Streptomyces sp. NPDC053048]|uniref:hypothetical protein n=1 Tax=Streptomyces sp. NPDC053048 TaxID=3365694 RepID=UPI0037D86A9C